MRSQIDACVISLGNSIKEAYCFACGFTGFAQSNIYIIYFEAMQNNVRRRAKDGFVLEKLGFIFARVDPLFFPKSFLSTF